MARDNRNLGRGRARTRSGWSVLGGFLAVLALLFTSAAGPASGAAAPAGAVTDLGEQFRHGTVRVGGSTIHFVTGGSGPPLLLLHGWPQTWQAWRPVLPALAERHTVIAMDLPGLGESSIPRSGFDKLTTARRIHQAVQELGFSRVDILGHDLGALIAYPYAREFPDGVGRMAVLESPLIGFGLEDFFGVSFHFGFNMSPAPIPEEILDNDGDVEVYLGMLFDGARHPEAIDRETYFRAYADPAIRSAGYEYYRAFPADTAYNQATAEPKLATPVLAMGAEFVFGPAVAQSFRNVASDVRPVVAPDSGHFIPEENPEFLVDCVRLFLGPPGVPAPRPELAGCLA